MRVDNQTQGFQSLYPQDGLIHFSHQDSRGRLPAINLKNRYVGPQSEGPAIGKTHLDQPLWAAHSDRFRQTPWDYCKCRSGVHKHVNGGRLPGSESNLLMYVAHFLSAPVSYTSKTCWLKQLDQRKKR